MNTASRVVTGSVGLRTSRTRRDAHMVRERFEEWLGTWVDDVAEDIDKGRAERLAELIRRSEFARQKDIADELDVETRTVQRWLEGKSISKRDWADLAEALDTTIQYLIFGERDEAVDPTQLDRVEAKLDAILDHLGISQTAGEQMADVLETAEKNADKQRGSSASKPRARKAGGH